MKDERETICKVCWRLEIFIIAGKHFSVNLNEYRIFLGSIPVNNFLVQIRSMLDFNREQKKKCEENWTTSSHIFLVQSSNLVFPLKSFSADSGSIRDVNMWMEVLRARSRGASGAPLQAPSVECIKERPQTAACWCNTGPSYCFGFCSTLFSSLIFSWWPCRR